LKQEALDGSFCKTGFGRVCGPVARQREKGINFKNLRLKFKLPMLLFVVGGWRGGGGE
jgi:hypothetical protein